ncbi:MAG: hypothetical protein IJ446_09715 [Oscillospiraceae bacterium]|nr:hypothetical protein [Oscillospiraceae bacterium]
MKRYRKFILSAVVTAMLLSDCSADKGEVYPETQQSRDSTVITEEAVTVITETETADAETATAITTEETAEETEEEFICADNQLLYEDSYFSVLMEFTGAQELTEYPDAAECYEYRKKDHVLHTVFTVTNNSMKEFDFVPESIIIYAAEKNSSWYMMPNTVYDIGIERADSCFRLKPEQQITVKLDFVCERECIEHADEIKYIDIKAGLSEDIVFSELKNKYIPKRLHITDRLAVKKAVSAALDKE